MVGTPLIWTPPKQVRLPIDVRISTSKYVYGNEDASGTWLDVNDGTYYKVAGNSFADAAVQFRRDEVTNSFLEGKFTVNALRDNVTETLAVYCYGQDDSFTVAQAVKTLTDAVSQIKFRTEVTVDSWRRGWWCYASDYTVNTARELLHARMALVTVQLQRDPNETLTEVF